MSKDTLANLLRDADRAPPECMPAEIQRGVMRRVRRRRRVRRGGAAAVVVLALAGGWYGMPRESAAPSPEHETTPVPIVAVADSRDQMARLVAEADCRRAIARRTATLVDEYRGLAASALQRRETDPLRAALAEVDDSAAMLVFHAERLRHAQLSDEIAADQYRAAMRLFPNSPWAVVASQRLIELAATPGESL